MRLLFFTLFLTQTDPHAGVSAGPVPDPSDATIADGLLKGEGLACRLHGSVPRAGLFVLTCRKPGDFFSHTEYPLVPADRQVAEALGRLNRHDAIRVKGEFIENEAPIRHIKAASVELIQRFAWRPAPTERIPSPESALSALLAKRRAIGKVHAIASDGHILVFEYGEAVTPVYVKDPKMTSGLFRNDKIRIRYRVSKHPDRPAHLWIDPKRKGSLRVLERVAAGHGQSIVREGELVKFQKSPQIKIDVYALRSTDKDGVKREYTLLNSVDADIFLAIQKKLADAWNVNPAQAVDGRNKLVNPHIRVEARGVLNVLDPNQANPQILLASPDDMTVTRQ